MSEHRVALLKAREHAAAGRLDQARQALVRVLQKAPGDPWANADMARLLLRLNDRDRARFYLERADARPARDPDFLCELGRLHMQLGESARALAVFGDAAALAPSAAAPRAALAALHTLDRRFASAARECREGLRHSPGQPDLANTCAMALTSMGRASEGLDQLRSAAANAPPDKVAIRSNLALVGNYCPGLDARRAFEDHAAFARSLASVVPARPPPDRPVDPERRLTVGFLSPDFIGHSVAYFIRPVVANLDRARFRAVCFSTAPARPGDEARRPAADAFHDVSALGIGGLDEAIRAQGVDVLVELSGHTMGNRLAVLRRHPAPVQVTYLGYPATTGLPDLDARFVDSLTDPAPGADAWATERLVRLDPCFVCYQASLDAPPVAPLPGAIPDAPITFGSFNALSKFNDELIGLWNRVLAAVPGSRLLLKAAGLEEEEVRADVASRFAAEGIGPGRIELAAWTERHADHMGLYGRVDVGLDSFPYNGTTTTAEALWMGVPVVSLVGERHAGRVGLSMLGAAGLPGFVARSSDDYVRIAAALASDRVRLADLRAGLRARVAASVLCDGPAMGRRFGDALRGLWRRWCSGSGA